MTWNIFLSSTLTLFWLNLMVMLVLGNNICATSLLWVSVVGKLWTFLQVKTSDAKNQWCVPYSTDCSTFGCLARKNDVCPPKKAVPSAYIMSMSKQVEMSFIAGTCWLDLELVTHNLHLSWIPVGKESFDTYLVP